MSGYIKSEKVDRYAGMWFRINGRVRKFCEMVQTKKGKEYFDPTNRNNAPGLYGGKILWYYTGKNSKGELFKGTAIINYLPEVKK